MQADFWNKRYSEKEYAYGKDVNEFVKQHTFSPKSKILCLAEGEGRNAVYLAEQGHEVTMIDYSEEGIKKARALAQERGVTLRTICLDLSKYTFEWYAWDVIVIVFGHFPPLVRKHVHTQLYSALKPNGKVILEAYSKEQLDYKTGGPQDATMLYSEEELKNDFVNFKNLRLQKIERTVNEGIYHQGKSSVIQILAAK